MKKFMSPVPERIKRKTAYLQKHYCMGLYDAFNESVRDMTFYERQLFPELQKAWTDSDYRNYIPQEYIDIALNDEQLAFKYRNDCIKLQENKTETNKEIKTAIENEFFRVFTNCLFYEQEEKKELLINEIGCLRGIAYAMEIIGKCPHSDGFIRLINVQNNLLGKEIKQ